MELPQDKPVSINVLSVTDTDGPAFNIRSQTCQHLSIDTSTSQPDITPDVSEERDPTPKILTTSRLKSSLTDAENWPFLQKNIKTPIKQESTSAQN